MKEKHVLRKIGRAFIFCAEPFILFIVHVKQILVKRGRYKVIRIVTDSASDIDAGTAEDWKIISVPLTVSFGDKNFQEGIDLSKADFYERLSTDSNFPKTSQVTPFAFEQVFREAKEAGDDVVAILLSSRMSGTYQSALLAKQEVYDRTEKGTESGSHIASCYIIDSRTASAGQQLLVEYAVRLRQQGASGETIAKKICEIRSRLRLYACVSTLEYLYRGGRISKAAATIGTIINVKPILYVKWNGQPEMIARMHGNQKAASYIMERFETDPPDKDFPVYLMYTYGEEGAVWLEKAIRKAGFQVQTPHLIQAGAVIGSHIGPKAFGMVYVSRKSGTDS